jgi:hypothetical protein
MYLGLVVLTFGTRVLGRCAADVRSSGVPLRYGELGAYPIRGSENAPTIRRRVRRVYKPGPSLDLTSDVRSLALPRHVAVICAAGGLGQGVLSVCRAEGIGFTSIVRSQPGRIGEGTVASVTEWKTM